MENNNLHEFLHKVVYAEKKVTKQQLKSIEINVILKECDTTKITLRQSSIIILALSKILNKRFKTLIEDCNNLLQILTTNKVHKIPSSKGITLNLELENLFIDDKMIDFEINEEFEEINDTRMFDNEPLDFDFQENPSIEQARNSTLITDSINVLDENTLVNINVKRRKIIEDKTTEITDNIFRGNLRNVIEILKKEEKINKSIFESKLQIDKRIDEVFKREAEMTVEEQRQASVAFEMDAPDFSFIPVEQPEVQKVENLLDFSNNFNFNLAIQNYSNYEKVISFLQLLVCANSGKIIVNQREPFGDIECTNNE